MTEEDWQAVVTLIQRGLYLIDRPYLAERELYDIRDKDETHPPSRAFAIAMLDELLVELYARSPGLRRRSMEFILNRDRDGKPPEASSEDRDFGIDYEVKSLQYLIEFIKSIDSEGEEK